MMIDYSDHQDYVQVRYRLTGDRYTYRIQIDTQSNMFGES